MKLKQVYETLKKKFADGEVNSPLQYKYVTHLALMMSSIGSWPHTQFGRNKLHTILSFYNLILHGFCLLMFVLGVLYWRQRRATISFFDSGHIFLCMIFDLLVLLRLLVARTLKYQETIKEYLLEFHLFYFKNRSPYAAKIHTQIHTISGMFTFYVICQMASGVALFVLMPFYNNLSNGMFGKNRPENSTFENSAYYYLPDACYTTLRGYWFLFAFNCFTSYIITIGLFCFDLLISLMVFQIWGHLEILKNNLMNMPLPKDSKDGMYSVEENVNIRALLKDICVHHNLIIKFVNRCSNAFSEYLFTFYLFMQFITCILLLEVSSFTADAIAKYGPLTIGMHQQLIQVSILFEMLNTKSNQLMETIYTIPWEHMDNRNRKTVMFLIRRIQEPVSLKAGGMVPVGVNTMSAVLKGSATYYMMLKAFAGEQ
ncbi:putative odorant receptor 92a [Leguminivora glycinivorella]|uniref:putative odorant receptor 92a n=1 Tax=Leguminivora glycinivorella TaxID=1035111 RepID=UPI002010A2F4|nr:putative odorant receptor 92a [Leguminivora glycinivorella]